MLTPSGQRPGVEAVSEVVSSLVAWSGPGASQESVPPCLSLLIWEAGITVVLAGGDAEMTTYMNMGSGP